MAEGGPPKVLPSSGHSKGNVGSQPTGGPLGAGAPETCRDSGHERNRLLCPAFLKARPKLCKFPCVAKRQRLGAWTVSHSGNHSQNWFIQFMELPFLKVQQASGKTSGIPGHWPDSSGVSWTALMWGALFRAWYPTPVCPSLCLVSQISSISQMPGTSDEAPAWLWHRPQS